LYHDAAGYDAKKIPVNNYFTHPCEEIKTNQIETERELNQIVVNNDEENKTEYKEKTEINEINKLKKEEGGEEVVTKSHENEVLNLKENNIPLTNQEQEPGFGTDVNNYIISDNSIRNHNHITPKNNLNLITLKDYELLRIDQALQHDNRQAFKYLKDMLIKEHAFLSLLFYHSLMNPKFLKLVGLAFILSMQFTTNALLFTSSDITAGIDNTKKVNDIFI
jgi:hypothetical protein